MDAVKVIVGIRVMVGVYVIVGVNVGVHVLVSVTVEVGTGVFDGVGVEVANRIEGNPPAEQAESKTARKSVADSFVIFIFLSQFGSSYFTTAERRLPFLPTLGEIGQQMCQDAPQERTAAFRRISKQQTDQEDRQRAADRLGQVFN